MMKLISRWRIFRFKSRTLDLLLKKHEGCYETLSNYFM